MDAPAEPEKKEMSTGLAALDPKSYGVTSTQQGIGRSRSPIEATKSRIHDLMKSIHDATYPKDANEIQTQTRLEWENIEGEVIGLVLQSDIANGTMLVPLDDDFFSFATSDECVDYMIGAAIAETFRKNRNVLPPFASLANGVNRLMISFKGLGRAEQIQALQALSISLQEQERQDGSKLPIRRL
jgi:hypothetical protein